MISCSNIICNYIHKQIGMSFSTRSQTFKKIYQSWNSFNQNARIFSYSASPLDVPSLKGKGDSSIQVVMAKILRICSFPFEKLEPFNYGKYDNVPYVKVGVTETKKCAH